MQRFRAPGLRAGGRVLSLVTEDTGVALGLLSGGVNVSQQALRVLCEWGARAWEAEEGV